MKALALSLLVSLTAISAQAKQTSEKDAEKVVKAYLSSSATIASATRELKSTLTAPGQFTGSCEDIDLKVSQSEYSPTFEVTRYCAQDGDNFGGFTVKGSVSGHNVMLKSIEFDYN